MKHAILPYNSKEYCRRKGHKFNPLISASCSSKQMECVSSSLPTSIWYWVFHSLICLQWVTRKHTKLRPPPLTLHKSQKMLPYREKVALVWKLLGHHILTKRWDVSRVWWLITKAQVRTRTLVITYHATAIFFHILVQGCRFVEYNHNQRGVFVKKQGK